MWAEGTVEVAAVSGFEALQKSVRKNKYNASSLTPTVLGSCFPNVPGCEGGGCRSLTPYNQTSGIEYAAGAYSGQ